MQILKKTTIILLLTALLIGGCDNNDSSHNSSYSNPSDSTTIIEDSYNETTDDFPDYYSDMGDSEVLYVWKNDNAFIAVVSGLRLKHYTYIRLFDRYKTNLMSFTNHEGHYKRKMRSTKKSIFMN